MGKLVITSGLDEQVDDIGPLVFCGRVESGPPTVLRADRR